MLTTNDEALWERAWSFKDHGKSWQAVQRPNHKTVFRWLHESIGTNWRMAEIQAAIGRVMLGRLPGWVETRRRHARVLSEQLGRMPAIRVTVPPDHIGHSYYKYYAFLRGECLRRDWPRDRIVRALQAEGIPCGSGVCPEIYREKAFDERGIRPPGRLPVARELGRTSLMLLVHPTLSDGDMLDMCRALEKVLRRAQAADSKLVGRAA